MAFTVITYWGSPYYCKGDQNYKKSGQIYYKSGQLLQIGAIFTNQYTTNVTNLKHAALNKPEIMEAPFQTICLIFKSHSSFNLKATIL